MKKSTNIFASSLLGMFLAVLFSLTLGSAHAQYWMKRGGGLTVDEAYDIDLDNSGNTYSVGYFTGTATFGGTTFSSSGSTDIFIVKTSSTGNIVWAKKAGGSGSDRALSVSVDGSGNSYVTGYFNGTANFSGQSVSSSGVQDVFIAKYNTAGNLQWVKKAGGSSADIGNGICVDNSGNAIVTGEFQGTSTFGGTTLTSQAASTDVFITKLDGNGNFVWTEHGKGSFTDRGIDVACDNAGNIYATGQFSDTITFDVTHNNSMLNVIYMLKYDANGVEQWFRIIGGASSSISKSIEADGSGNSYVVGDYTGTNLTFFGPNNFNLTNSYPNKIFLAKYSTSGSLTWAKSAGSDGNLTSEAVSVDGSGNVYIAGNYTCRLSEFADSYGQGTFNSVGYSDIFVGKYNSGGSWQYSRNVGGRSNDYAYGVDVNSAGQIHFAGSFKSTLIFPTNANYDTLGMTSYVCTGNSPYCSDPNYGNFHGFATAGNSDVVIANAFDPNREPYDFYERGGGGCSRPERSVCIEPGCPDTVTICASANITAQPRACGGISPHYKYSWTGLGDTNMAVNYSTPGLQFVTQTSHDGCFVTTDSIFLNLLPLPPKPTISDDVVINNNTSTPAFIELCHPDTVTLTGGNFGTNAIKWTGPGLGSGLVATSFSTSQSGWYTFTVEDANGCVNSTSVGVTFHPPFPPFDLRMLVDDTVDVCEGETVEVQIWDSISNPSAGPACLSTAFPYVVITDWVVTPSIPHSESCESYLFLVPTVSGFYTVSAELVRLNICETDTHEVTKTFYIDVLPKPVINPFTVDIVGSSYYCPGDSTLLVATGGPNYTWNGTGIGGSTNDSVWVKDDDTYSVDATLSVTNGFGCSASYSSSDTKLVMVKPQPSVSASSTVICPGDTVVLTCSNSGATTGFFWEGPNGPLGGNSPFVNVTDPGSYYCIVNDEDSCGLISNTIVVTQYTTPELQASEDLVLCEGDSVIINVVATDSSIVEWQPPLSGNDLEQTIYTPGIYTAKITSCGIETFASIEVLPSYIESDITPSGILCIGDSIDLLGSPGMDTYLWFPGGETTPNISITDSGVFVLTTTDTNGCTKVSDSVRIVIDQEPSVITLSGYPTFCEGDTMTLFGNSNKDNYFWLPDSQTTSSILVHTPGTYTLTTIDSNDCDHTSEPVTVSHAPTVALIDSLGRLHFCEDDSVILFAAAQGLATFLWDPIGDTNRQVIIRNSGDFRLTTIDTFGCEAVSEPVTVFMEPNNLTDPIIDDQDICAGTNTTLLGYAKLGILNWYSEIGGEPIAFGPTFTTPNLTETTIYYIASEFSVCFSDLVPVEVQVDDCFSFGAPNVFTPNGDGINDLFLFRIFGTTCFNAKFYNRWGNLVYNMQFIDEGWDGTVNFTGEPVPDGTYYWMVEYCLFDGSRAVETGYVSLLRGK